MEFLNYIKAEKYPCTSQTIFFSCSEIPSSFIYNFVKKLQQERSYPILFLDLSLISIDQAKHDISMLFLSGPVIYFIKNFSNLNQEQKRNMKDFFSSYEGPNYLFVFDVKLDSNDSIKVEDKITLENYTELFKYFYPGLSQNRLFTSKLFSLNKQYSINSACMLMNYEPLLGQNTEYFFNFWFDKIIEKDKSLFKLSEYLFAQNKLFFEHWNTLKHEYPVEFWIAFWSEQMFQAYIFVYYAKQNDLKKAQEIVRRLPFSFIKKDWHSYNLSFLSNAHEFLLNLDYGIKNGIGEINLELWYLKFIFKKFPQ